MKCPKCGSKNSDANRFCRACGCRLESIGEVEPQVAPDVAVVDEVALGEQLFEVWQLYSDGDIDGALAKIEIVSHAFPERSSIHSLFALIHERKAEMHIESGNIETARALLLEALNRYEKIVSMNPDSAADRQKLESLRRKLGTARSKPKTRAIRSIPAFLKSLPPGVVPAAAVFLLVLVVVGFMMTPGSSTQPRRSSSKSVQVTSKPGPAADERVATAPSPPPVSSPLRVYSFPAQGEGQPTAAGQQSPPGVTGVKPPAPPAVQPLKVPDLPDVKITPVKPKPNTPPKPAAEKPKQNIPADPDDDSKRENAPDGATTLARSLKLNDQGYTRQAITAAQQAIVLFDAEAAAGKNTASARRGAENARKLIGIWQTGTDEEDQ
jgi:tetratricopeptide (TPR) repeat protein